MGLLKILFGGTEGDPSVDLMRKPAQYPVPVPSGAGSLHTADDNIRRKLEEERRARKEEVVTPVFQP